MYRNIALDILKLLLSFMILMLHTGYHLGFLKDFSPLVNYLTVNGLFRIAVPIFFLINGYFFHMTIEKHKTRSWFIRVVYLYIFWMLVYSVFWLDPNYLKSLSNFIIVILTGYIHLWYLLGMLGAGLLIKFFCKSSTKLLVSLIIFTFLIGVFIQYSGNYHLVHNPYIDKILNFTPLHRNFLFLGFPFFGLGYLIKREGVKNFIPNSKLYLIVASSLILLFVESYINYLYASRDGGIDNCISLLILAPAIFLIFINLDIKGKSKNIALYASAIFFIHPIFILLYKKYNMHITNPSIVTFVVLILSIISAYFLIKVNKKLKFIL